MLTADPTPIQIQAPFGSSFIIQFSSTVPMVGYTFMFVLCDSDNNVVFTKTVANGGLSVLQLTPTAVVNALINRTDTVNLLREGPNYSWSMWRIDLGNERRLARGPWQFNTTPEALVV